MDRLQAPAEVQQPGAPAVVLSATFTADPLLAPLAYFLREVGLRLGVEVAPYGQVFQQLLDPSSRSRANRGGINVILLRLEDWLRGEPGQLAWSPDKAKSLRRNAADLAAAARAACGARSIPHVVVLCPPSAQSARHRELAPLLAELHEDLAASLAGIPGLRLLPMAWSHTWTATQVHDAEGDRLGHVPYTRRFYVAVAREIARLGYALRNPPAKVIVLDCDNTLWDGVVGEDGPAGVRLTDRHRALQRFVLAKKQAGMLLCLASKNVESDVLEVFAQRKDMLLRMDDIVALRVNWSPKSENMHALAGELNLGLDSFVFIDDNPVECAEVEAACPGVLAVCVRPDEDPARLLGNLWPLDILDVTDEDRRRSDRVRQNLARDRFAKSSGDLATFLAGLELQIASAPVTDAQLARVAQLTQRTNQFNLTTKRRSEADLRDLARHGFACHVVEVRDRFGDYGLVGVMIFSANEDALLVDSFLLSCRVLGRGVEHAMLRELGTLAAARGLSRVELPFTASQKNLPAQHFLTSLSAEVRRVGETSLFALTAAQAASVAYAPARQVEDADAAEPVAEAPTDGAATSSNVTLPMLVTSARSRRWNRLVRTLDRDDAILAHLAEKAQRARKTSRPIVPATTETERKLVTLWSDVLGVTEVGIEDDYVDDLGGTSLLAVSLFARIAREMGVRLPLATLVEAPTIVQLAARIDRPVDRQCLVLLNDGGAGAPLFLVHDVDGETLLYRNLAQRLDSRPVYGIQPPSRAGAAMLHSRIPDMAAHYVAEIRKRFPRGPYLLGGLCAGGVVAAEMALQLEEAGETARLVAVFDAADVEAPRKPHLESRRRLARVRSAFEEQSLAQAARAVLAKVGGFVAYQVQTTCTQLLQRATVSSLRYYLDRGERPPAWLPALDVRSIYGIAEAEYHPNRVLRDEVILFRASEGEGVEEPYAHLYDDPMLGWGNRTRASVRVFDVPGGHGSLLQEPHVSAIAKILRSVLADEPKVVSAATGGRAA